MTPKTRKKRRFVVSDENTILVVTSFADHENRASHSHPIALHAKRVLTQLSKKQNVIVLAEETGRKKTYKENPRLMVHRVWKRRNPFSLFNLIHTIIRYNKASNLLVQFDFTLFGGLISTFTLIPVLLFAKLLGKRISFELHQAPEDITLIKRHNHIRSIYLKSMLNQYLKFYYWIIGLISDKVIVFEEELRDRMEGYIRTDKIVVLPMAVSEKRRIGKSYAKRRLHIPRGNFTALSFGFFDWHKGSDWIANTFADMNLRGVTLLLVGGKHPSHRTNLNYRQFYKNILKKSFVSRNRIRIIDFIPEARLAPYYSAADLIVLPYRQFMSAPTALTKALSFRKPVIFSTNLTEYAKSPDFAKAQHEAGLKESELFFPLNKTEFQANLHKIRTNPVLLKKLGHFSSLLAKKRSHRFVSRDYEVIISRKHIMKPRFAFR